MQPYTKIAPLDQTYLYDVPLHEYADIKVHGRPNESPVYQWVGKRGTQDKIIKTHFNNPNEKLYFPDKIMGESASALLLTPLT
jgi:hypothetical protein